MSFLKKPSTWLLLFGAGYVTVVAVALVLQAIAKILMAVPVAD